MVRLNENAFLTELSRMYERHKSSGSVWVTIRSTNDKPRKSKKEYPDAVYKCLVRAVAGKKPNKKDISVLLEATQVPKFQSSMLVIMKANMMDTLKKKEKTKVAKPKDGAGS